MKNQQLKQIITKGSDKYYLLCRSGNIAIYEQIFRSKTIGFEVIKIKKIKGKEIYPGGESFGKLAWYYTDFDKAVDKYNILLASKIKEK